MSSLQQRPTNAPANGCEQDGGLYCLISNSGISVLGEIKMESPLSTDHRRLCSRAVRLAVSPVLRSGLIAPAKGQAIVRGYMPLSEVSK